MTPENQALLDAIHGVAAGVERLDTRMEHLDTRMEHLDTRMEHLDTRMEHLETRMEHLDTRMDGLEEQVATIDTRTNQMSSDLLDLRERVPLLEERVDNGFRALRSDLKFAFSDARNATMMQERNDKAIEGLRHEIAGIQQRLAALEASKGAS